ncbi:uncharacterized protein LOC121870808 [Homarus americanus]|uniref:uncharacterized protein LOC121870808 n=1 Tax=Homarus americanus TaxID=6706 RepID=UPI001C473490|nr:uncharacterized protein LOC121870808 [Homarus americanus]
MMLFCGSSRGPRSRERSSEVVVLVDSLPTYTHTTTHPHNQGHLRMTAAWWQVVGVVWASVGMVLISVVSVRGVRTNVVAEVPQLDVSPLVDVTVARGDTARLPCRHPHYPDDTLNLVLWYLNHTSRPFLSYDARGKADNLNTTDTTTTVSSNSIASLRNASTSEEEPKEHRYLEAGGTSLVIRQVLREDQAEYRCRVHFRLSPTWTQRLLLLVPEKVKGLVLEDSTGRPVGDRLQPVAEGANLTLTCQASHGKAAVISLTWLLGGQEIDTSWASAGEGVAVNQLSIVGVEQRHRDAHLTCRLVTADHESHSHTHDSEVHAHDSDVQAHDSEVQAHDSEVHAHDSEVHAHTLPMPASITHRSAVIAMFYVPEARLKVEGGRESVGGGRELTEGEGLTFLCAVDADPPVYNITWLHNGRVVGVGGRRWMRDNASLVVSPVERADAGLYTCLASNREGDGHSNAVLIRVKHAPYCVDPAQRQLFVATNTSVTLTCQVEAVPEDLKFTWKIGTPVAARGQGQGKMPPPPRHSGDLTSGRLSHPDAEGASSQPHHYVSQPHSQGNSLPPPPRHSAGVSSGQPQPAEGSVSGGGSSQLHLSQPHTLTAASDSLLPTSEILPSPSQVSGPVRVAGSPQVVVAAPLRQMAAPSGQMVSVSGHITSGSPGQLVAATGTSASLGQLEDPSAQMASVSGQVKTTSTQAASVSGDTLASSGHMTPVLGHQGSLGQATGAKGSGQEWQKSWEILQTEEGVESEVEGTRDPAHPERSTLTLTPAASTVVGCYVRNSVGHTRIPCTYTLTVVEPPKALKDCNVTLVGVTRMEVKCDDPAHARDDHAHAGVDAAHMQQHSPSLSFVRSPQAGSRSNLEVWSGETLVANVSEGRPQFTVRGLPPSTKLRLVLYTATPHARSTPFYMYTRTLPRSVVHFTVPPPTRPSPPAPQPDAHDILDALGWEVVGVAGGIGAVVLVVVAVGVRSWVGRRRAAGAGAASSGDSSESQDQPLHIQHPHHAALITSASEESMWGPEWRNSAM